MSTRQRDKSRLGLCNPVEFVNRTSDNLYQSAEACLLKLQVEFTWVTDLLLSMLRRVYSSIYDGNRFPALIIRTDRVLSLEYLCNVKVA